MSNLTRYKMKCIYDCEEGTHVSVPRIRKEGEWVKFDDHVESLSKAYNNARDEILLCGLTGVKCGNRIRVCKLEFSRCSGQSKTSPVA